jgi:plastocyanin
VSEDGYEPDTLEVRAGEVVLLVNGGDELHSFTADDQRFDTGRMEPGEETTLVLTEPGESTFHDVEAPDHEGTLTVRDQ